MKTITLVGLLAMCTLFSACAPGANGLMQTAASSGASAGFWLGLWHGAITPITFVISLFREGVSIYEVHNNGAWYNFGFLLGAHAALGGHAARRSWRKS